MPEADAVVVPRQPTGVEHQLRALIDELELSSEDRRMAQRLLGAAVGLFADRTSRLDLKIASAALHEMREAFRLFAPYHDVPKVTIFGSARTRTDDPLYLAARDVARCLAEAGWMVVTGAGPGIMQAAMEGAGRERSIGVAIRLPFEQGANPIIAGDEKYVSMKYFFTRKLMLIKESRGFISLPGGFGTLDETFELLTLTQTGKGLPVPIVLLDNPGDQYWDRVNEFVRGELVVRKLIAPADTGLYLVTDDSEHAAREILEFYANYDSLRYVDDLLVIRIRHRPTDAQLEVLNERFGHLCATGRIEHIEPLPPEVKEGDRLDFARIALNFAKHGYGDLRTLIDAVNDFVVPPPAS